MMKTSTFLGEQDELVDAINSNRMVTGPGSNLKSAPDEVIDNILLVLAANYEISTNDKAAKIIMESYAIVQAEAKRRNLIN